MTLLSCTSESGVCFEVGLLCLIQQVWQSKVNDVLALKVKVCGTRSGS